MTSQQPVIPQHARERLQEMRGGGGKRPFFTSDLSVNEFLLVKESGFEPLGMVVGSSIYHIGIQMGKWSQNMELDVLTQAMYEARELAMSRMEEEADILGADGIVGVRLIINEQQWGENLAEFMAIGTAIVSANGQSHRTPQGKPFTSDLSGQEFWTLLRMGYRPLALVMGSCVYHVAHQGMMQAFKNTGRNVEMANFTQGIYDARELAMERMQNEAEAVQADGIVGMRIEEKSHGWGSQVIEYFAVGTAVTAFNASVQPPAPTPIISFNDPS